MKRISWLVATFLMAACAGTADESPEDETANAGETAASPPAAPSDIPAPPDVAAVPADASKTASGLSWKTLKPGTGTAKPNEDDQVKVHYTGWQTDGKMFDSSVKRGQPATFGVNRVIKGWTEGLQLMVAGEKRRFWIPAALAYGETPQGGRPGGMLVFDVELLEIIAAPKPPADVAAAPADAKQTKSGLAYKILKKGTGTKTATEDDRVEYHFTGWTTGGKLLSTSKTMGRTTTRPINRMPMEGWKEALMLLHEGDTGRFWIPQQLALKERPPAPGAEPGPLTFDFEMIKILASPKAIAAPSDVKAAPASATRTSSGLAYKVMTKGSGAKKPAVTDRVKVHYTGWTTDGKMFDSSVQRGSPATFPVNRVIKGWTEGLQLMTEGEKTRFWIPAELAYGNSPGGGRPSGLLVFDVELIAIQ